MWSSLSVFIKSSIPTMTEEIIIAVEMVEMHAAGMDLSDEMAEGIDPFSDEMDSKNSESSEDEDNWDADEMANESERMEAVVAAIFPSTVNKDPLPSIVNTDPLPFTVHTDPLPSAATAEDVDEAVAFPSDANDDPPPLLPSAATASSLKVPKPSLPIFQPAYVHIGPVSNIAEDACPGKTNQCHDGETTFAAVPW